MCMPIYILILAATLLAGCEQSIEDKIRAQEQIIQATSEQIREVAASRVQRQADDRATLILLADQPAAAKAWRETIIASERDAGAADGKIMADYRHRIEQAKLKIRDLGGIPNGESATAEPREIPPAPAPAIAPTAGATFTAPCVNDSSRTCTYQSLGLLNELTDRTTKP